MGWSTSAPSGVSFLDSTSVTATKTWNHVKLVLTVWTARKAKGGDEFYLKVKATWKEGSLGDYANEPGFYWQCPSGSGSASDKQSFYERPLNGGNTQYRYYSGVRASASDEVTVRLSSSSSYPSGNTLMVQPTLAASTYAVGYNANGGSGAPASQTKKYGTNLTLSTVRPIRSGYAFTGWNTKADGSGTDYAPGAVYTANAALTLYAKWQQNPTGTTAWVNAMGSVKQAAAVYVNVNGVVKEAEVYANVNGVIKKL